MSNTKDLIAQRTGMVALSDELFTEDQRQIMVKVLEICDRNPVIKWIENDPNHNLDFCLVEGKIEPVKGFCLKCIKVAGLSVESESPPVIQPVKLRDGGDDTMITVSVSIASANGPRFTLWGGSSIRECDNHGKNRRAIHDALARAQTRALKLAVETAVGMPFVNAILLQLFGGYEVRNAPEDEGVKNITPIKEAPESRAIWKRIWGMLKFAKESGYVTEEEMTKVTFEVKQNMDRPNVLLDTEADWKKKIQDRIAKKGE
jgi:hypothetical protein